MPSSWKRKPTTRLIGFSEARSVYLPAKLHSLVKDLAKHEGKGMRVMLVEVLLRGGLSMRLPRAFPERREEILKLFQRLGDGVGSFGDR
jgi:hypothetical protein